MSAEAPLGTAPHPERERQVGRARAWWSSIVGALGTVTGLLPHVLHHVGLVAGTALVAGVGGTAFFAALGLLASVPMLIRLRRRFGGWWAPTAAMAAFAVLFAVSTFVLGPLLRPTGGGDPVAPSPSPNGHNHHHPS